MLFLLPSYSCCHAIPVDMLFLLPCYCCCHAIPVAMLFMLPCCSCCHAIPVTCLYPLPCFLVLAYSCCLAIPGISLFLLPCSSCCHAIPVAMLFLLLVYSCCHDCLRWRQVEGSGRDGDSVQLAREPVAASHHGRLRRIQLFQEECERGDRQLIGQLGNWRARIRLGWLFRTT